MKIAAALAALGLALLTGCALAESALSQVEPIIVPGRRGSFHGARERPLHCGHPY